MEIIVIYTLNRWVEEGQGYKEMGKYGNMEIWK